MCAIRIRTRIAPALLGLLLAVTAAAQGLPSPNNSVIGGGTNHERINLGGFLGGTSADSLSPGTTLRVLVRDLAGNPVPNALVILDFTGATTDFVISSVQSFHGESATASSGGRKQVENTSAIDGSIVFAVTGAGVPGGPPHAPQSAQVYAGGVLLGSIGVGVYDRDAIGGQDGPDLAAFAADYFAGGNADRSDYNGVAGVTLADLVLFAQYFFGPRVTSATGFLVAP